MKELQRFLIRNNYPHRIVEVPTEQVALLDDGSSNSEPSLLTVTLSDGRV